MKPKNFPARRLARQYAADHRRAYRDRHITAAEVYAKNVNNGGDFTEARNKRSKKRAI